MERYAQPRFTLPIIVVLLAGVIGLGAVAALRDTSGPGLVIQSCTPGEPGCNLREPSHEHADFALFIRGQRYDFNQPRFVTAEGPQADDISPILHIHPPRFSIVHVHMSRSTWDEFFTSLGFKITDPTIPGVEANETCLETPDGDRYCNDGTERLRFFRNGVEVDGIILTEIQDMERVLITFGDESDEEIQQQLAQVSDEACIASGWCLDRVPEGEEPEPCTGRGACIR